MARLSAALALVLGLRIQRPVLVVRRSKFGSECLGQVIRVVFGCSSTIFSLPPSPDMQMKTGPHQFGPISEMREYFGSVLFSE